MTDTPAQARLAFFMRNLSRAAKDAVPSGHDVRIRPVTRTDEGGLTSLRLQVGTRHGKIQVTAHTGDALETGDNRKAVVLVCDNDKKTLEAGGGHSVMTLSETESQLSFDALKGALVGGILSSSAAPELAEKLITGTMHRLHTIAWSEGERNAGIEVLGEGPDYFARASRNPETSAWEQSLDVAAGGHGLQVKLSADLQVRRGGKKVLYSAGRLSAFTPGEEGGKGQWTQIVEVDDLRTTASLVRLQESFRHALRGLAENPGAKTGAATRPPFHATAPLTP